MRVAVIGSGVAGLAATWAINEYSSYNGDESELEEGENKRNEKHQVNLYEAAEYVGGHTHTVEFERPGKVPTPVDTGFIVCNPPTYPNFLAFLKHIGVQTIPTTMTFAVSRDGGVFEWAGKGLRTVFVQGRNILNPRIYRMLFDVFRFNLFGLDLVDPPSSDPTEHITSHGTAQSKNADLGEFSEGELSIGQWLKQEGYGPGFIEDYLLPMTAAIWSTPADKAALDFPAKTLIRFFHNHHLMQVDGRPSWLTVKGGAKQYVDKVIEKLPPQHVHLNTEIVAVTPRDNYVTLREANGTTHDYDYVILATHSDTALQLLRAGGGATKEEEDILGAFEWSKNEAVLHWDEKFMPIRKAAWSAWNYLTTSTKSSQKSKSGPTSVDTVSLTYDMNQLQSLPESRHGSIFLTLNPPFDVDPSKVVGRYQYEHPMYSAKTVRAQYRLPQIQNVRRVTFAGAWTNYGFHEDGFTSGIKIAADHFDAKLPFPIRPANREIKRDDLERRVVQILEVVRKATFESSLGVTVWNFLSWAIVLLCFWSAQIVQVVPVLDDGTKAKVAREVRAIQGFWETQ